MSNPSLPRAFTPGPTCGMRKQGAQFIHRRIFVGLALDRLSALNLAASKYENTDKSSITHDQNPLKRLASQHHKRANHSGPLLQKVVHQFFFSPADRRWRCLRTLSSLQQLGWRRWRVHRLKPKDAAVGSSVSRNPSVGEPERGVVGGSLALAWHLVETSKNP